MAAAVASALDERKVLGVLDRAREFADRLGQQERVVLNLDARRNLRLRQASSVNYRVFAFHLLPLEALLVAHHVETLAVLAADVE